MNYNEKIVKIELTWLSTKRMVVMRNNAILESGKLIDLLHKMKYFCQQEMKTHKKRWWNLYLATIITTARFNAHYTSELFETLQAHNVFVCWMNFILSFLRESNVVTDGKNVWRVAVRTFCTFSTSFYRVGKTNYSIFWFFFSFSCTVFWYYGKCGKDIHRKYVDLIRYKIIFFSIPRSIWHIPRNKLINNKLQP